MGSNERIYKGDQWTRRMGSLIPVGAIIRVRRFYPRRRVLVEYGGELFTTMLWCLVKMKEV